MSLLAHHPVRGFTKEGVKLGAPVALAMTDTSIDREFGHIGHQAQARATVEV